MKYRYYMWVAKHERLAFLCIVFPLCLVYAVGFTLLDLLPVPLRLIICALIALVGCVHVSQAHIYAESIALRELNDRCNPYPLLDTCRELMEVKRNPVLSAALRIDYALALKYCGRHTEAYETMASVDTALFNRAAPFVRFIYYNNRSDLCTVMQKFEEAEQWYSLARTEALRITAPKQKRMVDTYLRELEAMSLYGRGLWREALDKFGEGGEVTSVRHAMEKELFCAKLHLKLGEADKATVRLERVVQSGNLTYLAAEARSMLAELVSPESEPAQTDLQEDITR